MGICGTKINWVKNSAVNIRNNTEAAKILHIISVEEIKVIANIFERYASQVNNIRTSNVGTRRGVGGQNHTPVILPSAKSPHTHFTGGLVGRGPGKDGCGKSHPHRDSNPGLSNSWCVVIVTTLSRQQLTVPETHNNTLRRYKLWCVDIQTGILSCY